MRVDAYFCVPNPHHQASMFTINIYLRFFLIIATLLAGFMLAFSQGFWYGFPLILIGIFLLLGYLFLGTILTTNQLIGEQKLNEAEKRLGLTFFPGLLLMGYKGVFYMSKGAIDMQRKDFNSAEKWIKKSLASGLPSDNERGAAMLQLTMIYASKNNRNAAVNQFSELRKLSVTEPMLKEQIREVDKQMKQMGQAMNPSTMGMMGGKGFRPGGKRKTPKMR